MNRSASSTVLAELVDVQFAALFVFDMTAKISV